MQHFIKIFVLLSIAFNAYSFEVDAKLKSEYSERLKTMNVGNPPELSAELKETISRIKKRVDSEDWRKQQLKYLSSLHGEEIMPNDDAENSHGGKYMLFISSSMPLQTLRNYAQQMEELNGALIIRGGIGGIKKINPTLKYIKSILVKKKGCLSIECPTYKTDVLIDPKLFTQYNITTVPALAFTQDSIFKSYCERGESKEFGASNQVVYGDASLRSLVTELGRVTGIKEVITKGHELP